MIANGSRYQSGTVVRMLDSNGVAQISVLRSVPAQAIQYSLYTWQQGDRPDSVAAKTLGDPSLWWEIFDINPELINPLNIPPGTIIRIPLSSSSDVQTGLLQ
jgi:nucleoid-associated protein YgaU